MAPTCTSSRKTATRPCFASYILVTAIEGGVVMQSTALVSGRVRRDGEALLLAELEVVLDTKESVRFRDR